MAAREGWPSSSFSQAAVTPTSDIASQSCSPTPLPASGVVSFKDALPTTLAGDAVYQPFCGELAQPAIIANGGFNIDQTAAPSDPGFSNFRDPFYASIFPQCYALAATTVLAYVLFTMLIIVPRSFLDGGVVVLGRRGFTNGPSNGISIGGRPWLQKVAALTVTISLTIATVDTFRVAEEQYAWGIQNANELQVKVLGGTQLKVIQLISDTFLWLAQAQTLIRLFPRQREKIIIKWTAFSLITLDVIFGALNSFHYSIGQGQFRPRSFTEPIPALSYLFQLSLGLLYAAWVLYYSLMKKRYAFYHPLMKNISLMAFLSIISILVPVVFFILDIAEPEFTGWGEYVRWVGAAAASVVVWEWVERIEALEREEKKDGILGREVFDGDEMMDNSPSDLAWPRRRKNRRKDDDGEGDGGESAIDTTTHTTSSGSRTRVWPAMSSVASRYKPRTESSQDSRRQRSHAGASSTGNPAARILQPPLWLSRPPPAVTPVSRTDTASADSTVYTVRHQPLTETASRTTDERPERPISRGLGITVPPVGTISESREESTSISPTKVVPLSGPAVQPPARDGGAWRYLTHLNPFHAHKHDPPAEIIPHTTPKQQTPNRDYDGSGRWDLKGRVEDFAATYAEKVMEKVRGTPDTDTLPVTVIPAPPRRGAALAQLLEEEERAQNPPSTPNPQLTISSDAIRSTRSTSNATEPADLPPLRIRSHSAASNASRLPSSPGERIDTHPTWRTDSTGRNDNLLSPTGYRGSDRRDSAPPRNLAERQPADEALAKELT